MGYSPKWQPWPVICYYFKKMVILSNKIIMDMDSIDCFNRMHVMQGVQL